MQTAKFYQHSSSFNLVAQCALDYVDVVRNALNKVFNRVEVAYTYDRSAALGVWLADWLY